MRVLLIGGLLIAAFMKFTGSDTIKCLPYSTFEIDCNVCTCDSEGVKYTCTRKVCDQPPEEAIIVEGKEGPIDIDNNRPGEEGKYPTTTPPPGESEFSGSGSGDGTGIDLEGSGGSGSGDFGSGSGAHETIDHYPDYYSDYYDENDYYS